MTLKIEAFRAVHVDLLFAGGVQASQISLAPSSGISLAGLPGYALTAWADGRVIMCGGVVPFAPWLGTLWAILSKDAGRHMVPLHKASRRFLASLPYRRLEASAPRCFPAGCRFLELLHFTPEGVSEAYGEDGEDHLRYARVRRG
ncbi:MAG TPA: hypothetical protein VMU47_06815 [Caldimonas sp.]|nr:hypothetical protein [Caldimonas sp.]